MEKIRGGSDASRLHQGQADGDGKPSARDGLIALLMVGRNIEEYAKFGRVLTEGERREVARLEALSIKERHAGHAHKLSGGKLKANPHPGDSLEWWSWHEGYKSAERQLAAERRHSHPPSNHTEESKP